MKKTVGGYCSFSRIPYSLVQLTVVLKAGILEILGSLRVNSEDIDLQSEELR